MILQYSINISFHPQSKLNRVKEEKENENKNLLIRCQEAEKSKLLAEETANKELIELRNNLEQLHTEVRDDSILIDRFI